MHPPTRRARRLHPPSDSTRSRDERGFVLVWYALLIFVMLGVTAFAVDLGHAYLVAQHEQDAADAAALSAASYLPDNCPNANAHAQTIASINGFTNGSADTTVTAVNGSAGGPGCDADPTLKTNEIRVQVKRKVETWFARAIGIDSVTVSRTSVAEYDPPVALGSPTSYFGNPVGCTNCGPLPGIWASVDGRANKKVDGNAISAEWCAANVTNGASDNCDGDGLNNSDLDTNGMLLQISNPTLQSLNIELYDPGFIDVVTKRGSTQALCDGGITYPTCTGDSTLGLQTPPDSTTRVATKYTLYPLDSLTNPLGSSPICSVTYPGYTDEAAAAAANDRTWQSHDKWANLATDAGGACGALNGSSYVLQVQGGDDLSGPAQGGSNMFAVAACSGCAANQPQNDPNVAVSAITKMSIFTNSNVSNPEFYLARIPTWAQGQALTLNFFDIGDVGTPSVPGALTVFAADATHGPSGAPVDEFANCKYSNPAGRLNDANAYFPNQITPWDPGARLDSWTPGHTLPLTGLGGGCTAQVTINQGQPQQPSYWNGKWVTFQVAIPGDYTCNDADFTKCWLKIKYNYPGASSFHDATTWTAVLSGNPVRLTK
jgi:Flp pilus assembly protein TadG